MTFYSQGSITATWATRSPCCILIMVIVIDLLWFQGEKKSNSSREVLIVNPFSEESYPPKKLGLKIVFAHKKKQDPIELKFKISTNLNKFGVDIAD